jgi:hypothetical protein
MSKINKSRLIQTIAIGFILVLCPAVSWYYLQKGLDYQKESRKELAEIDAIKSSDFIPEYIKSDSTLLDKRLRMLIFNSRRDEAVVDQITSKLHDQFESSNGFFIIEFVTNEDSSPADTSIEKNDIHIVKTITKDKYDDILSNVIGIPIYIDKDGRTALDKLERGSNKIVSSDKVYAYLVDENDKVRNVYDLMDESRVKRMVEHTAILIPKLDKEEVELKREREL